MLFSGLILTTLAGLAASAPAFSGAAFQITNLHLTSAPHINTTLTFTAHDPDPLSNATAICSASWPTNSTSYPQDTYDSCPNSTFAWNIASVTTFAAPNVSFVLGVEHLIHDPSVGDPPYDYVLNFAHANVSAPPLWCVDATGKCTQRRGTVIQAPIYASAAKKR